MSVQKRYLAAVAIVVVLVAMSMPTYAQFTQINTDPSDDWDPAWSPDGSQIAFTSDRSGVFQIWVMPVAGGPASQLTSFITGCMHPIWSPDGSIIAFMSEISGNQDVWTIPATGGVATRITTNSARDESIGWSHGGARITFDSNRSSGNWEIWTIPVGGGTATRVTNRIGYDTGPFGSCDGTRIAYSSDQGGNYNIWTIPADGGVPTQITFDAGHEFGPHWSPDDSLLVYMNNSAGNWDLFIVPSAGGVPVRLTTHPSDDAHPSWSPDGSKIAFTSARGGDNRDIWTIDMTPTGVDSGDRPMEINRRIRSYPNPFSAGTTIQFELDHAATASIAIYDVKGRLVRTLADGRTWSAGAHDLTWDGTNNAGSPVSSGRYFCEVDTPDYRGKAGLVLIR